jgi:4-hydroxy-tetrahydrodipicolinate synthase
VLKGVLHAQGRIPTQELRLPITHASSGAIEAATEAIRAVGSSNFTSGPVSTAF